jgi:Uma2 family endonuclease
MDPIPGTGVGVPPRADSDPAPPRPATRADLDDVPENMEGEIIEGRLYVLPRRRSRHMNAAGLIHMDLASPYQRGVNGPGGWWILMEPGVELPEAAEIGPDVAGWRRERLPELPGDALSVTPDWVCEVLSPGTRRHDLGVKRPFYAKVGVQWMWIVDLEAQLLTVSRLHDGYWSELHTFTGDVRVRAEPFEAVELDLAEWWRTK